MTVKRLKFHKINLYTFKNNSDKTSDDKPITEKNLNESRKIIYDIVDDMMCNHDDIFSYDRSKKITIEFLNSKKFLSGESNGIIFGKLSKIKDYHNFQKRRRNTKNEIDIIQSENEIFESRTFFIIDTNNLVVSYISERSAPSVRSIGDFFSAFTKQSDKYMTIRCNVTDIMSKDTINSLSKNEYIGDIKYVMEIPDNFDERDLPLKMRDYKKLHNQSKLIITIQQKALKRGVSIFGKNDTAEEKSGFFESIKELPGIKSITAKTRDKKTDKIREAKIGVDNPFMLKVNFNFNYSSQKDDTYEDDIYKRICMEYNDIKDKIDNRIRHE